MYAFADASGYLTGTENISVLPTGSRDLQFRSEFRSEIRSDQIRVVQKPLNHWGKPSGGKNQHCSSRSQTPPGNAIPDALLRVRSLSCSLCPTRFVPPRFPPAQLASDWHSTSSALAVAIWAASTDSRQNPAPKQTKQC
jgi:hypothetical protein